MALGIIILTSQNANFGTCMKMTRRICQAQIIRRLRLVSGFVPTDKIDHHCPSIIDAQQKSTTRNYDGHPRGD